MRPHIQYVVRVDGSSRMVVRLGAVAAAAAEKAGQGKERRSCCMHAQDGLPIWCMLAAAVAGVAAAVVATAYNARQCETGAVYIWAAVEQTQFG